MESQRWRCDCAAAGDVVADMGRPWEGAPCESQVTEPLSIRELTVTANSAYPRGPVGPSSAAQADRASATSARRGPLRADIERVERLARRHEQPVPLGPAEGDVAAHFGQADAADQLAVGVPDGDARVADVAPGVARGPQV